MKKNDMHERICGCRECKRRDEIPPPLELKEPEKQRLPKEPVAVPPDGGG